MTTTNIKLTIIEKLVSLNHSHTRLLTYNDIRPINFLSIQRGHNRK